MGLINEPLAWIVDTFKGKDRQSLWSKSVTTHLDILNMELINGLIADKIYDEIILNSVSVVGEELIATTLLKFNNALVGSIEVTFKDEDDWSAKFISDPLLDNADDPLLDNDGNEILSD